MMRTTLPPVAVGAVAGFGFSVALSWCFGAMVRSRRTPRGGGGWAGLWKRMMGSLSSSSSSPSSEGKGRSTREASIKGDRDAAMETTTATKTTKKSDSEEEGECNAAAVMNKDEVLSLRRKHFSGAVSVSYSNSDPLMILGGRGSRLTDSEGRTYLDTRNNVCHVGHQNPAVVEAVTAQMSTLNTNTRYLHPNASILASRLASSLPDPLEVVFFVNSGSEANDLALRLARAWSGGSRNTVLVDGAYHGHTLACLEVSPYKYERSAEFGEELRPQRRGGGGGGKGGAGGGEEGGGDGGWNPRTPGGHIWKVPRPDTYRGPHRDPKTAAEDYASYVREGCEHFADRGEKVGAFIVEGGMSVGGVILPPPGYLRLCVDAVRDAGGLYIADEVQTGFGRLGTAFWAFQHGWRRRSGLDDGEGEEEEDENRVVPDIVTVGKPFGNGMPLAAVVTTREVSDNFETMGVEYFNTFGGNPVSCAAGLAVLDELERNDLQRHALDVGTYLKEGFWKLSERLGTNSAVTVGDVRGSGLFLGVELIRGTDGGGTSEPATAETSFVCTTLKEKYRVLTSIDGPDDNVIVVKPPMVFSKDDCDEFLRSFERTIVDDLLNVEDVKKLSKTPT